MWVGGRGRNTPARPGFLIHPSDMIRIRWKLVVVLFAAAAAGIYVWQHAGADAHYRAAVAAYRQRDYPTAESRLTMAIWDAPPFYAHRADCLSLRGWVHYDVRDYATARRDFDAALDADPDHVEARVGRGNARWRTGDYGGAEADFGEAVRLAPDDHRGHYGMALVHIARGAHAEAEAAAGEAIARNPDYGAAYLVRAAARRKLGDAAGATADQDKAVALDPSLAGRPKWGAGP